MSRRRTSAPTCQIATTGKICVFCGLSEDNETEYGKMYELGPVVTHYYCLLLSSMMEQRGRDDQGILGFLSADIQKELRRGKRLNCFHCKKIGATLGCCNTKCKRIFHLPCGLRNGSLHQFYGEFRSYCINHRPKQLIDSRVVEDVQNAESTLCYICYDNVNYMDILKTLWAPCCKKNAFFHRKCVQQLANSSGYFFKCPLCNNKKEFQEAMLEHGIFIPLQDASWELVPNAYQELLYRHNQCDAETCVCPKGRKHAGSNAGPTNKWELVLCRICGSQGIHRHCGHLKWSNSTWECAECQSIIDKSPIVNRSIREEGVTAGDAESGEPCQEDVGSDSELSVGQNSSEPNEYNSDSRDSENLPTVKVRPGPLSYKMKEVMKVAQSRQMTKDSSCLEEKNSSTNVTDSENGDIKKIDGETNTVILLDSDEEPEDIEIISEKLNSKVLTTKDGRKIEIFDLKRRAEQHSRMNKIGNQSTESTEKFDLEAAARRNLDSVENMSTDPLIASNSLHQKESKPTITDIQTVKNLSPPKSSSEYTSQLRANAQLSNTRVFNQILTTPTHQRFLNQQNSSTKFVNSQNLSPRLSNSGNIAHNQGLTQESTSQSQRTINPGSCPQNQRLNAESTPQQRISNAESTPQHSRVANPQISNLRLVTSMKVVNPQMFNSGFNQGQMSQQMLTPLQLYQQTLSHQKITAQFRRQRPLKIPNQRDSPQIFSNTLKKLATSSHSKPGVSNENNKMKTVRAVVAHVPQFSQPNVPAEESIGIKISSVCSLAPEVFESWETEKKQEEGSEDLHLKRKAELTGPSQDFENQNLEKRSKVSEVKSFVVSNIDMKTNVKIQGGEIKCVSSEETDLGLNLKDRSSREFSRNKEGEKKGTFLKRNLVEEALAKANITQSDMMSEDMSAKSNQPSTSSVNITNNYITLPQSNMTVYMGSGESQEVLKIAGKKAGDCYGDAGTSPRNFPGRPISPIVDSFNKDGVRPEDQIIAKTDSRIGSDSLEDSKFSVLCGSISEGCHELSENSSSCDSAGLIPDSVSLSDVKFRVCGSDIVQVILYDKYRIDIKMDNTGSRSSQDSDSSTLPCPSCSDDFSDSHDPEEEIPPKRIRDFEFEENTLQEFPCTSRPINILESPSTGVTTREKAAKIRVPAKESLNPVEPTSLENERPSSPRKLIAIPFSNDFCVSRQRKNLENPKDSGKVEPCLNCKVSIDLKKIQDLLETKPHLFSKCDEAHCKYKSREHKLTGVCKIKNKWLLVKSQSEKDFYGVSTRSRLLYKSKSMDNLSASKEIGPQKREETKNCPTTRTGLRRGLKRKCRFSVPCR